MSFRCVLPSEFSMEDKSGEPTGDVVLVEIDERELNWLINRALDNKSKKSKGGPIRVKVIKHGTPKDSPEEREKK